MVVSDIVSPVAVPVFFLIAGVLLYVKPFCWKENCKKKVVTLLLPYLIWNTLQILFYYFCQSVSFTEGFFTKPEELVRNFGVIEWVDAYLGIFSRVPYPFYVPFWFLRNLFILNLLGTILKKAIDEKPIIVFFILVLVYLGNILLPLISVTSLFFFTMGYFIVKFNIKIELLDKLKWLYLGSGYLIILVISYYYAASKITIIINISIIIGCLFWIKLSKNLAYYATFVKMKWGGQNILL